MKTKMTRLLALILCVLAVFSLTGCSGKAPDYTKGDNADFVKAVALAVTTRTDDPSLFSTDSSAAPALDSGFDGAGSVIAAQSGAEETSGTDDRTFQYDLDAKPVFQPYFAMLSFHAKQNKDDPSLVHYSCRIPGAVTVSFNMAYDVCFDKITKYSKWIKVEGDLRVVKDADGNRKIDISQGDNAFATYAALRYINPLFFTVSGIDISHGLSDEDFSTGLNILLNRACDVYAPLMGVSSEDYAESTVIPELEKVQAHMLRVVSKTDKVGYGFRNWYRSLNLTTKIFLFIIVGVLFLPIFGGLATILLEGVKEGLENLYYDWRGNRKAKPRDLYGGKKKTPAVLDKIVQTEGPEIYKGEFWLYCQTINECKQGFISMEDMRTAERLAVALAVKPYEDIEALKKKSFTTEDVLRFLCQTIHQGMRADQITLTNPDYTEEYRRMLTTAAGWSAAAAGRIVVRQMTPGNIAENLSRIEPAIEKFNAISDELRKAYQEREELQKEQKKSGLRPGDREQELDRYIKEREKNLNCGLGGFMLDNGDLPLAYLVHLLSDSQSRIPRFIRQGVIMGLVDWLVENKDHPEAKKLLDMVLSVRADMIRSDNQLTFFEVRVPADITRNDYALLLKDVLHCANPSIQYCDTEQLLDIAEKEVPGCMKMLYACPLRLIDPVNRKTLGFYQFKPYIHAMFVQYLPPLNTGTVISRYHEVDDLTKPLSSGLNLALFQNPWAVIPTIFHEYQHFCGDPNEASVFLKTQMFSIRFYKKYPKADAKADGVFAQLTTMLGLPPAEDKRGALNQLIERCYGRQLSQEDAEKRAESEIAAINAFVDGANARETWDPDVKMPHLADGEDEKNRDLIQNIVIRFATVPKSVTAEEFDAIVREGKK